MLINRLSPTDQPFDKEVKYMLTADIERMANLIGVHVERLRKLLSYNSEGSQSFYGSARPEVFFLNYNQGSNADKPRRLGLGTTDVRLHGAYRVDASQSLITVPLTVMHPTFVGDLQNEDGVEYELIPHVKLTAPHMGCQSHYVFPNMPQPFRGFALEGNNTDGFEIELSLLGFDLILLPDTAEPQPEAPSAFDFIKNSHSDPNGADEQENHNVIYDYGFNLFCEHVYTSDNRGDLRIDHYLNYKDDVIYTCEAGSVMSPNMVLHHAMLHLKDHSAEFPEAIELMRMISTSEHYSGLGYRRS